MGAGAKVRAGGKSGWVEPRKEHRNRGGGSLPSLLFSARAARRLRLYPPAGHYLQGLPVFDDAVFRGDPAPLGAGVHETVAANDGAGGKDSVAADLRAIANDGAKLPEASRHNAALVGDGDLPPSSRTLERITPAARWPL